MTPVGSLKEFDWAAIPSTSAFEVELEKRDRVVIQKCSSTKAKQVRLFVDWCRVERIVSLS